MPTKPRLRRTRYDIIRECECDMRRIIRDMPRLRTATDTVQRLFEDERRSKAIDGAALARARKTKKQLLVDVRAHWERLHRRMDQEREDRLKAVAERDSLDRVRNYDIERRASHGVAANP
jgi:hypothetical protein